MVHDYKQFLVKKILCLPNLSMLIMRVEISFYWFVNAKEKLSLTVTVLSIFMFILFDIIFLIGRCHIAGLFSNCILLKTEKS